MVGISFIKSVGLKSKVLQKTVNLSLSVIIGASGLAAAIPFLFSQSAMAANTPSIVYDATSSSLPPNVASVGFQATSTSEFGDYVHLGGTDRALRTVTVTMSDWGLFSDYSSDVRYSGNNANWTYPLTLNVYSNHLGLNGAPDTLLATKTQTATIPWRPAADPTCSNPTAYRSTSDNNCYSGVAFNVTFNLASSNAMLPNDVIIGVAYNTQSYGAVPEGVPGPYNSLNVGAPNGQLASSGTDDNADNVFWNTSHAGFYADGGTAGVGIFREDTNWTPNGTAAFQITAAPATVPDSSGNATVDNTTPTVLIASSSQAVNITVADGTTNAGVDYSALKSTATQATIPQTTISSSAATVSIPATQVTASSPTWDGIVNAPTILANSSVSIGSDKTVATVIDVGAGDISLTFNNAVRLLIPGQAGKLAGFVRGGNFTAITTTCTTDSQSWADTNLPSGGDCYANAGSDLVIWTKHFTTFVTYTQTQQAAAATSTTKTNSYTVVSGDTMSEIAAKFGLTLAQLEALNPTAGHPAGNFSLILPGDVLSVGGAVVTASTSAAAQNSTPEQSTTPKVLGESNSPLSTTTKTSAAGLVTAKVTNNHTWYWWATTTAFVLVVLGGGSYYYILRKKA